MLIARGKLLASASCVALLGTVSAHAQDQATLPESVVVTGTRIIQNGYEAPTPVTVAPVEQLQDLAPTTVPDALNKLPVFAGSTTAEGGSNGSGISGNYLNLRDFGINRTLILMNGLRVAPNNFNGQVDVNSIPQLLLQRVDIVTGGASAVYGSDAVTGVVNFVMDTRFDGVRALAQTGVTEHGDAGSFRYGLAAGSDVFNLGHVEFSFEQFQQGGLLNDQRRFSADRWVYTGTGTPASPYTLTEFGALAKTAFGGYVQTGPFAGQQFLANGQLGPFNPGTPTASATVASGGDAAYYNNEPLLAPQDQHQIYGRFDHDITPDISFFMQATDTWNRSSERASNWPAQTLTFFSGNPFLPASAQAALTAAKAPSFTAAIFPRDLNLLSQQNQLATADSVTAGLTGRLFDTYDWQASYTHGAAIFRQELTNNIDVPNFLAAVDTVQTPSGPACFVSTAANASQYSGCVPLDVFGVGNESTAAENFIFQPTRWRLTNLFDDYTGSITGSPLDNWAGPVSVALNAEYRQLSLLETTTANPLNAVSLTGLRDVPRPPPTSVFAYATVAPSQGANSVWEVSGESVVPIAKDMVFAKSLDLNGAVRFTNYSTSGSVWTWKAGLDYQPVNDVRIRATESRDIRAPTLYDLFAGQSALVRNLNDPHTNTSRVLNIITQGNPNLVPEVALTTTAGVVYSPSWFQNFRMSVDYYNISLDNAITTLSGNDPTILQQCEAVQWNSAVCSTLIARPLPFSNISPANFPTAVYSEPFNVARTWTDGVDVEASYGFDLADLASQLPGNLFIRLLYSYQPTLDTINFPGSTTTNAAGAVGLSSSRATLMVDYMAGPVRLGWSTRYYSPELRSGTPGQVFASGEISAYTISDINLDLLAELDNHNIDVFFNVQNVFDVQPRIAPNITFSGIPGFGNGAVPGDDLIGRYFIAGLRLRY